jgi:hypothetical protein
VIITTGVLSFGKFYDIMKKNTSFERRKKKK